MRDLARKDIDKLYYLTQKKKCLTKYQTQNFLEILTLFQLLVKFDSTVVPAKTEREVSSKTDNLGFVNMTTKQQCRQTIHRNFNFSWVYKTKLELKTV